MDGKAQIINAIPDGENVGLELTDEGSFQNKLLDSFKPKENQIVSTST